MKVFIITVITFDKKYQHFSAMSSVTVAPLLLVGFRMKYVIYSFGDIPKALPQYINSTMDT